MGAPNPLGAQVQQATQDEEVETLKSKILALQDEHSSHVKELRYRQFEDVQARPWAITHQSLAITWHADGVHPSAMWRVPVTDGPLADEAHGEGHNTR